MEVSKIKTIFKDFLDLLKFISPENKKKFYFLQIQVLVSAFLESLTIFSVIPFLESLNNKGDNKILTKIENFFNLKDSIEPTFLLMLFIIFFILSNIYLIIVKISVTRFSYNVVKELQIKLFKKFLNKKYNFFISKEMSYFHTIIMGEVGRVRSGFIETSLLLLAQISLILITTIGLLIYNFLLTSSILIVCFIFYLIYYFLVKEKVFLFSKKNTEYRLKTFQYLNDIFSIIKVIIFKRNKSNFYLKLENILTKGYLVNAFEQIVRSIVKNTFELYFLSIILIILFFKSSTYNYINIIPSYGVFFLAAYKIIPTFHNLYGYLLQCISCSYALNLVLKELSSKQDNFSEENIDEVEINKISLSKVFFSYDNKKNILKNISLDIDKNSSIGICGKSGSGKTTFIDIVSGLISPTSGIIKINNGKTTYKNEHLIYNSSYCSQKTILIEDTIENNIALASVNEKIDKNKIYQAIDIAELHQYVDKLEMGINTIIGEYGTKLSGGEAQRIGIARTLYSNKDFLIFDESLNNLDLINSKKIIKNLKKMQTNKTLIFVTHDVNLMYEFEKILVFEDGKIINIGDFSYLEKNCHVFRELLENKEL